MIQCIDKMKWSMAAIHASFAWCCLSINVARRLTGVWCVITLVVVWRVSLNTVLFLILWYTTCTEEAS